MKEKDDGIKRIVNVLRTLLLRKKWQSYQYFQCLKHLVFLKLISMAVAVKRHNRKMKIFKNDKINKVEALVSVARSSEL